MNDNELINTGISGFEPYQFDPAVMQVMPTGYDRVANRAQRRITDTQKRVQDLVKLDPTNPLSLFITMLGANQTAGIRDDLRSLRQDSVSKQKKKLAKETAEDLRKTQLADLKIRGLEDAFGTFINREHHGDVNAGLNDPDMQDKVLAISKEYQPMSTKELAKLMQTYSEENTAYNTMRRSGGDQVLPREKKSQEQLVKSIFAIIKEHFEHQGVVFKPGEWALEPPDEKPTDDTSTSGKVDPAGSNKVDLSLIHI